MDISEQLEQYTRYAQGDLSQACSLQFEDIIFERMDFSKYDLNNSTFLGVQFLECNFNKVYLSGTSFCGNLIQGGTFNENILRKADWDSISIRETVITALDAFRTSFYEGDFCKVIFSDCRLEKCSFSNSTFDTVQFVNCDLSLTSFNNAHFRKALFCNCIFHCTTFDGVDFDSNINFEEITLIQNDEIFSGLRNDIKSFLMKQPL